MGLSTFFSHIKFSLTNNYYFGAPQSYSPLSKGLELAMQSNEWKGFENFYVNLPHGEKHLALQAISQKYNNKEGVFDPWIQDHKEEHIPNLFNGAHLMALAWEYRGYGKGEEVTEDRFELFFETLNRAYDALAKAKVNGPQNSEVISRMIRVLMGLQATWEDIDWGLSQLDSYEKPNLYGYLNYLIASCEKWHGSHDKMFEFAKQYSSKNIGYGYMLALIPSAHIERWLYMSWWENIPAQADTYFQRPEVKEELLSADEMFANNYSHTDISFNLYAHNLFAYSLYRAGEYKLAQEHIKASAKRLTPYPWDFLGLEEYTFMLQSCK